MSKDAQVRAVSRGAKREQNWAWVILENKKAYRLHNQLSPHQAIGAVLQKLLDGVLVLLPGHRSSLTNETNTKKQV